MANSDGSTDRLMTTQTLCASRTYNADIGKDPQGNTIWTTPIALDMREVLAINPLPSVWGDFTMVSLAGEWRSIQCSYATFLADWLRFH